MPVVSDVVMEDVTGATSVELSDASAGDLILQINDAAGRRSLLPLVVLLWLPVVTIPIAVWLRARDKARRTVVIFYDVDDAPAERFQGLANSFAEMQQCSASWYVVAEGAVRTTQQFKTHAGASGLVERVRGKADVAGPPVIATNIAVPSLHGRKRSVYFLPDRILVRDGRRYADIAYSKCQVTGSRTNFIEDGLMPSDAVQVGTTWKYVNKSGGPDRRYKDNRQLPVMQYGELTLSTASGFHFVWQTSRANAALAVAAAVSAIMD